MGGEGFWEGRGGWGDSALTNSSGMARYQLSVSHKEEKICLLGCRSAGWLHSSSNRRLFLFRQRHVALPAIFFFLPSYSRREVRRRCPRGDRRVLRTVGCEISDLMTVGGGRKKRMTLRVKMYTFFSPFKKKNIYMSKHLLSSDAPSTINPDRGVKSRVTPI